MIFCDIMIGVSFWNWLNSQGSWRLVAALYKGFKIEKIKLFFKKYKYSGVLNIIFWKLNFIKCSRVEMTDRQRTDGHRTTGDRISSAWADSSWAWDKIHEHHDQYHVNFGNDPSNSLLEVSFYHWMTSSKRVQVFFVHGWGRVYLLLSSFSHWNSNFIHGWMHSYYMLIIWSCENDY